MVCYGSKNKNNTKIQGLVNAVLLNGRGTGKIVA